MNFTDLRGDLNGPFRLWAVVSVIPVVIGEGGARVILRNLDIFLSLAS